MSYTFVETKVKLWTAHYIKILIVGFVIGLCNQMQTTTLPLYVQSIGGNKTVAGLMIGVYTISALFFRPIVGNFLDRKGRKVVLIIGVAIFALSSVAYSFAYFVWLLILLRLVHGMGFSAFSTATGTIVSDVVPTSRLMEGIGYYGVAATLATAIGPALGLYLFARTGANALYIITFWICVVGLIVAILINYEKKMKGYQNRASEFKKRKNNFFEPTAIKPSLVMFFTALAQGAVLSFLPSYALTRGISNIGIFFTVYAIALMISRPTTGRLSDRYGATKIIVPGMFILIFSLLLVAVSSSLSVFIFIGIIYGLGSGAVFPVLNAITIKICPPAHRGSGNATFLSSVDAGYGIGSILWGMMSQNMGLSAIYFGAAGCVTISFLLYIFTLRKLKSS